MQIPLGAVLLFWPVVPTLHSRVIRTNQPESTNIHFPSPHVGTTVQVHRSQFIITVFVRESFSHKQTLLIEISCCYLFCQWSDNTVTMWLVQWHSTFFPEFKSLLRPPVPTCHFNTLLRLSIFAFFWFLSNVWSRTTYLSDSPQYITRKARGIYVWILFLRFYTNH